jgi:hypothetical protein
LIYGRNDLSDDRCELLSLGFIQFKFELIFHNGTPSAQILAQEAFFPAVPLRLDSRLAFVEILFSAHSVVL